MAEQPAVVHAADRDIYSAEQMPGVAGGSATDVLQGVPDLEVDINGAITMNGESPVIYINGREAPMTGESLARFLEQFAAENIERVEVIPNPSARYNAEGAGGIVNIVLKKDVGLGISGSAFLNGGTSGQLGGGGRGTYQKGPLTVNGGTSLRLSSNESTSSTLRQNLLVDPVTFLQQDGRSDRSSGSANLDLGADYKLRDATELSAEARVRRNTSDAERVTRYTKMDAVREVTDEYDRLTSDEGTGDSMNFSVELTHEFRADDSDARQIPDGPGDRPDELRVEVQLDRGSDYEESLVERRSDSASELTWEEDRETESELGAGVDYRRGLGESSEMEIGYEAEVGWTDEGRLLEVREPASGPT